MTPKEKADELVNKFMEYSHTDFIPYRGGYQMDSQIENAKQCALIAVDEILNTIEYSSQADELSKVNYWQEIKQEIEKI